MLNNFIKNQGMSQTILHTNNHNHINQTNWDAKYDGKIANISVDTNTDGHRKHYNINLDNQDLAHILNIQSVNMPIDKRLKMDFQENFSQSPDYYIELPAIKLEPLKPKIHSIKKPHISSPLKGEELLIPLTIDRKTSKKYTSTSKGRHKRLRTHITHKVYKKPKTKIRSSSRHKKSRRNSKKTLSMSDLL
jgi:hypothetical protein